MDTRLQDLEIEIKRVQLAREQLALRNELEKSNRSSALEIAQTVSAKTLDVVTTVGTTGVRIGSRLAGYFLRLFYAAVVAMIVMGLGIWWISSFGMGLYEGVDPVDIWAQKFMRFAMMACFFWAFVHPPGGKLPEPPPASGNAIERALKRAGTRTGQMLAGNTSTQRFIAGSFFWLGFLGWAIYMYVRMVIR